MKNMKLKLILLLINLGLATSIFSQSLLYLYDAAGNRITRMQVATRSFVLQKRGKCCIVRGTVGTESN